MADLVSFAPVTMAQATAILQGMRKIAGFELTAADRASIVGAAVHVLSVGHVDPETLAPIKPEELAEALGPDHEVRRYAMQLIGVMSVVDGEIDVTKLNLVVSFSRALDVEDDYVTDLAATAEGHIQWIIADMIRHNVESIHGLDPNGAVSSQFMPYDERPDPQLAARFAALEKLPHETLGRSLFDQYVDNNFAFPGNPGALSAKFGLPHDSTHLLSGYSTSFQGELLISTFTAAMHRSEGMAGHILPVIYSWHLGVPFNVVVGSSKGNFDAEKFWRAWERGRTCRVDTFGTAWNFWALTEIPLQELRDGYGIPALDPAHAADGTPPPVRAWPV